MHDSAANPFKYVSVRLNRSRNGESEGNLPSKHENPIAANSGIVDMLLT